MAAACLLRSLVTNSDGVPDLLPEMPGVRSNAACPPGAPRPHSLHHALPLVVTAHSQTLRTKAKLVSNAERTRIDFLPIDQFMQPIRCWLFLPCATNQIE